VEGQSAITKALLRWQRRGRNQKMTVGY